MPEPTTFHLSRFYYGTLAGAASGQPDLIASTPDLSPERAHDLVRLAPLLPPARPHASDEMPGALAIMRNTSTEFLLAKAQINDADAAQALYLLMPLDALRALEGRVMAFRSLGLMSMPSFNATRHNLVPYDMSDLRPLGPDEQIESLNDLLLFCQDSFKHVEALLAALVQGWALGIVNSPPSLEKRLRFVQGLLSFLPVPARMGITFTTHATKPDIVPCQIKFTSDDPDLPDHLLYDWQAGVLHTDPPEDSYSRYMVSQLRLDPSLVVEQTRQLSHTTVWRATHRENLGAALAWVSRRAALDSAVREGQPVDRTLVATILREDPTLSDDLRLAYARHLLAFSLALDEPDTADEAAIAAVSSPEIAQAIHDKLQSATKARQALNVFRVLEHWLTQLPDLPPQRKGAFAVPLEQAAVRHLANLAADHRLGETIEFIDYVRASPATDYCTTLTAQIIKTLRPAARNHPPLARTLLLLAVEELTAGDLHRLLRDGDFVRQLPQPFQKALLYLQPKARPSAPARLLEQAVRPFGDGNRMLVLVRLVEWAMYLQRPELIDTAALQALIVVAQSQHIDRYRPLIEHVIDDFSELSILQLLEPPGPRVLVQLHLLLGNYDKAVGLLEYYQNTLFGLANLEAFTNLVSEVFLMTPLALSAYETALARLEGSQIRLEPRCIMYCCTLERAQWSEEQTFSAQQLTEMLHGDTALVKTIGAPATLKLLGYHARQRHSKYAQWVASALVDYALTQDRDGALVLVDMWPLITWDEGITLAGHDLLRRYLRRVPLNDAPLLIRFVEEQLGEEIGDLLRATYILRIALDSATMRAFAEDRVMIANSLFCDLATVYHTSKDPPPNHRLRRDLDTMTGGLTSAERKQVADNVLAIARQIYELGNSRTRKRGQKLEQQLIAGDVAPLSGVDLLYFIGGHLANHRSFDLDLEREAMAHVFGNRSAAMFMREMAAIHQMLEGLQSAFADDSIPYASPSALGREIDSLWSALSLAEQRDLQMPFARACQQLAAVISIMADRGNNRIFANGGLGRQLETGQRNPRSSLETLRWIHGYFAHKHIQTRS